MATPSNPITRLQILQRRGTTIVPLHSIYSAGATNPAITFSRRVPVAVAAIPQSAYRTFMRASERTRVRLHAICEHDDTSNVRDGHLCDRGAFKCVIDEHAIAESIQNFKFHLHS